MQGNETIEHGSIANGRSQCRGMRLSNEGKRQSMVSMQGKRPSNEGKGSTDCINAGE
ncbi:hypothetical protein [Sutcliffiella deserti]|uniref:hypothetical protein n=1 Tax=Sutcliffiella deserti TaxID=2875501 RepID=UPI001CBEE0DD|nr:hypothetical protein [Sutcliffiella deserti]